MNHIITPFIEFEFMRHALISVIFLSLSAVPVGVFLVMRRMSLIGDAMSHAVLPGAAIGYMFAGLSLPAMSLGGFIAGLLMAAAAGLAGRFSTLKEDASFAAFYLGCLALGVVLVSRNGSSVDLLNLLFGSVLAVDKTSLILVSIVTSISILLLAIIYRPLILESIDPLFMRTVRARGGLWHLLFLMLVVINLVAGFQAMGTLMSVGLMMMPAICARLWVLRIEHVLLTSIAIAIGASILGLLLSFYINLPSGASIILVLAGFYLCSLIMAPYGMILPHIRSKKHHRTKHDRHDF